MTRRDLLALTPEAIASLANVGLVKRAQRDLAAGSGPALEELEDETVVGTFTDGVVTRLPRDTPLKVAPCTCGAANVCRHRVAVALAYPSFHATQGELHDAAAANEAADDPSVAVWSPSEIDDAALERALGAKTLARARAIADDGMLVTIDHEAVPAAKLPSCTVRFLVPRDIAYARCDCALAGGGCEHLALAVWAFRLGAPGVRSAIVALGATRNEPFRDDAVREALALAHEILRIGIAASEMPKTRFARLRAHLERERMTWVHELALDLEIALEGYHARSARFGTREISALLCELGARTRASAFASGELPPRFVVGEDQAPRTRLDHVRLVSLGARLDSDGRTRFADVYLADPDTAQVLVLHKRWDYDEKTDPDDGAALGRKLVAAGIRLEALARGNLVSKVVDRRANGSVELGSSRAAQTSVTLHRGEFAALPAPLLVRDLVQHGERLRARPPRALRPRVLAEDVHVVEVSTVGDVHYSAAQQRLIARLHDAAGHPFDLVTHHRRVAPHAIETTAAALAGSVRFVAGELVRHGARWSLDPLSIAAETLIVPDLGRPALAPLNAGSTSAGQPDPIDVALASADAILDELCHGGLASPSRAALARAQSVAQALDDAGLAGLALRIRAVETAARTSSANAPSAWMDAAIRLALIQEAAGQ